jgi:hypothetical protein
MEFITKNPALLLIDIQKALLDKDYPGGKRNNHDLWKNFRKMERT